jgi:hypothetical protein
LKRSLADQNPLVQMAEANSLLVDLHPLPREAPGGGALEGPA